MSKQYYDIDDSKVVDRAQVDQLPEYPNNNPGVETKQDASETNQTSQKLYRLQAGSNGGVTGLGITLKVMGRDKVSIFGRAEPG